MMMNKEERVKVVVSFGLGFLFASFIFAFFDPRGVTHSPVVPVYFNAVDTNAFAEVAPNTASDQTDSTPNAMQVSTREKSDGLYALVKGEEILLSSKDSTANTPIEGIHVAINVSSVSPSGKYIHFCEEQTTDAIVCTHYVYDVENRIIHRVTANQSTLATEVDDTYAVWEGVGSLNVNGSISAQAIAPWTLQ